MESVNRKSFLRTLGLMGAGSLLAGKIYAEDANKAQIKHEQAAIPVPKRVLRVAHLTDIHVKNDYTAEYGMAAALHAVNNMADKPDFIVNGGDAIMNAASLSKNSVKQQWDAYNRILKNENSLQVYNCIGNHDLYGWLTPSVDHAESKKWALEEYRLKKSYYSFTTGPWKFIVLDSIHGRKSVPGYYGRLDAEQMEWLKTELATAGRGTHICIISHIPILAICCLFDKDITSTGKMNISDNNMHSDTEELVKLFYEHQNVRACLSGHIHLIDYVNYLGTEFFCNGAVAGEWWKGKHQQFDPAFCMMNLYDNGSITREVVYYKWQA